MKLSNIKLAVTLLSVTLLALPGCGGGSSSTPEAPAITISGVAATGAAFVDAVVSVIDRTGTVVGTSTPVGSDGVFSVTLASNAQAPFVLVASRTDANGETRTLVSVVESTTQTTANVTPITNLIAARLSPSGDPAQLASELAAGTTQITPEAVANTVAEVQTILAPLLTATGTASADPLKDPFSTNGTGYDLLLDAINISIIPASDNSSNIEITVKQQLEEGEQPTGISFSSATTEPPSLPTIDANKLPAEGLSVKVAQFLDALTACYAVPFEERVSGVTSGAVNAVVGSAASVQATACRQVFSASNPATFLNNGSVVGRDVNNSGAFASLFRRGATGLTFSQGSYEFTRANGDIVISYKSRGSDGSENYDTFVLTDDGDGVLRLIGNQYRYGGKVSAYHQLRNFITLNQSPADYHSTGYDISISNEQTGNGAKFNRVVVTTPNNSTLTLKPNGNASFLGLVKPGTTPTVTGTSFVRLRSEYVNTANGLSHPSAIDTNLFFVGTDRTETELANAKAGGTWKFEYFLNADDPNTPTDDTTVPVVQYYKNRARALTIAELRTQGLAQLSPTLVADIASGAVPVGNPNAGQIQFAANETALIGTDNNGPGWSVASGQLPPTSITLFGSLSGVRFTDSLNVLSTARSATVPCSRQSDTDNHCHNNGNGSFGPGFAEGASLNGLHLFARDAGGREYANFYAMYNLNLAP